MISVSSPETSFWCLSVSEDRPSVEEALAAVVSAFEDEYDEVDVYASEPSGPTPELCGQPAVGRDVEFVYLEMVNTARVRAIATGRATIVVMYQGTDHELAMTQQTLEKISDSLVLAD